jgi:hypothetical protein
MSDDKIMCIVNAPRIEIVLVPENQAQREGDEVEDDSLLDGSATAPLGLGWSTTAAIGRIPVTKRTIGERLAARHELHPVPPGVLRPRGSLRSWS